MRAPRTRHWRPQWFAADLGISQHTVWWSWLLKPQRAPCGSCRKRFHDTQRPKQIGGVEKCDLGSGGPEVADYGFAACS